MYARKYAPADGKPRRQTRNASYARSVELHALSAEISELSFLISNIHPPPPVSEELYTCSVRRAIGKRP